MLPTVAELQTFRTRLQAAPTSPLQRCADLERVLERAARAERALGELDQKHLTVGLLGGTGVGKSTLLNAIAGTEISRPGDRRPTTERAVSYRHREDPAPAWLLADDVTPNTKPHGVDSLRGVLLLDLPDLDSFERGHRQLVHRALPHLDLLLVVTNGEKYGDQVLYDEIEQLPQAPRNLVFVLNAIDLLTADNRDIVRRDFSEKLARLAPALTGPAHGAAPTIYSVSALQEITDSVQRCASEFKSLLEHLERLAGTSERRAVLAANADAAVQQLAVDWRRYLPPTAVASGLAALRTVATTLPPISVEQQHALRTHLEESLGAPLAERALRASWFPIGPIDFFLRRFRKKRVVSGQGASAALAASFQDDLLDRPLRLARHAAAEAVRQFEPQLTVAVPTPSVQSVASDKVDRWLDQMRNRAARWAWRLRQHLLPGATVAAITAWIIAKAAQLVDGDVSWTTAIWDISTDFAAALSPPTIAILVGSVIVYYLLVYPYFLYWLDRRVQTRAQQGAKLFVDSWAKHFREVWGEPIATTIDELTSWWEETQRAARPITRETDRAVEQQATTK
ncbi:MAG: GTPase [Planctomycetota bacterium]